MRRSSFAFLLLIASLAAPAPRASAAGQTLTLVPAAGTLLSVVGTYPHDPSVCPQKQAPPLRARYRGTLTLSLNGKAVRVVESTAFETYLRGLAEVPSSWPEEALRAQAIAARSYALHAFRRKSGGAFDICSTDACQVYRGATTELGAFGERWVAAVTSTKSRVLTYRGGVIEALYFSTSDGTTGRSFPGGTPQPYFPSVSGEDGDAPLARWTVRVPFADLGPILRAAGAWRGGAIRSVTSSSSGITVSDGARSTAIARLDVKSALNRQAVCVFPTRYPTKGAADGGKLPSTVPGSTFSLSTSAGALVLTGRGWGHGIGMSQWGARSLAARGRTATEILSHYYGPARITPAADPGSIRVLAADGLSSVSITANGPFTARTSDGRAVSGDALRVLGGSSLQILHGSGSALKPLLSIVPVRDHIEQSSGAPVTIEFTLSSAARVSLTVTKDGKQVYALPAVSMTRGAQGLEVTLDPGTYSAVLHATDGIDDIEAAPVAIVVPFPRAPLHPSNPWPLAAGIAGALAIAALAVAFALRARRSSRT
ncbi:MAG: SpoIID/LytB domain-containing protein [Actinomycetota bacterium]